MHLVVLQHGVWGSPSNTRYLANLVAQRLGTAGFVLNYADNLKFVNHGGIDVCGERLFHAVKSTHDNLVHQGAPPTHISFIGYSAGGLITRYAAGRLFSEGYFDHVTPLNFVTVATPHLGSWRTPGETLARLVNATVPTALSRTGAQLFLSDTTPWGPPLLCVLTAPGLHFMAALRCFRTVVAMANVRHDRIVSFGSAAMQLDEPYPERDFEAAVSLVDPAYPSIVRPRKLGEETPHASAAAGFPGGGAGALLRRPLRGTFLLALVVAVAAMLSPLLPFVGLALLLQGWLHGRRAAADATLRKLYDSWGGGGGASAAATAAADAKQQQRKQQLQIELGQQPQQSQQQQELPHRRPFVLDVESGGGLQQAYVAAAAAGVGGGGTTVTVVAVARGESVKGSPERRVEVAAAWAVDDPRLPLHRDHLRQQQLELFAGLPPTTDKQGLREWLAARLAALPVRRVHVDTRDVFHAHSGIIVWNRLFLHCRDGVQYLTDACMMWG